MRQEEAIEVLKGLLELDQTFQFVTRGTSMEPFIKAGDLIQVEATLPSQLKLGDLMAFQRDGRLIVHRFAGWKDQSGVPILRQKGDNVAGHGSIHPDALIGRVVWTERGSRRRDLLHGRWLVWSRLYGYWAWGVCFVRESASWVWGLFRGSQGKVRRRSTKGEAASREQEILILAARLQLTDVQAARLAVLLGQEVPWPALLKQGARFGMLPLLNRHLSGPSLAPLVPEKVRASLADAYHRTSLKNLRMLGLLRRFLLKAQEAGVEVILLKGAHLAKWVYGDVGLRPMNDLDLLCHKEDEPVIWRLLESMGGYRSKKPAEHDPGLSPVRTAVEEKLIHSAPWWFTGICRIEVHYHLLSANLVDDTWLQDALWSKAVVLDWEGLPVRTLDPEHLVFHLASHLYRHMEEKGFNLYWFADLREVLSIHEKVLDPGALLAESRRIGIERDCASVFSWIGEPWGGVAGHGDKQAVQTIAACMNAARPSGAGDPLQRSFAQYMAMIKGVRHADGFINRARYLRDLLILPPWKMAREYRTTNRLLLPFLYFIHPLVRLSQGFRGTLRNVQRRLGH